MSEGNSILRVQMSLVLEDKSLYDGLIVPYKDEKILNPLVVKLLSSYFYNQEVRSLVDEYSESDAEDNNSANEGMVDLINSARESLTMMNLLSNFAKEGLGSSIDSVMETMNSVAKDSGGQASQDSQWGTSIPKVNIKKSTSDTENSDSTKSDETTGSSSIVEELQEKLVEHDKKFESMQGTLNSILSAVNRLSGNGDISQDSVSKESTSQVSHSEPVLPQVLEEEKVVVVKEVKVEEVKVEEIKEEEVKEESAVDIDGSDILSSFLANGAGFTA